MSHGIGTIQIKREHGKLIVQGLGQTPRGQKFIVRSVPINAPRMSDKKFKEELAGAVKELMD